MSSAAAWESRVVVRRADPAAAERLYAALAPEAAREVPRARVRLSRSTDGAVEVRISARDTGALRAGLNTFLGWVALTERVERELAHPD